ISRGSLRTASPSWTAASSCSPAIARRCRAKMSVGVSPFEVETGAGIAGLRAAGLLRLEAERGGGQTFAAEIDEQGPLRVRFPRIAAEGTLEGVLVNTGGGIVGGDRLRFEIEAGEGTRVALTTQAS